MKPTAIIIDDILIPLTSIEYIRFVDSKHAIRVLHQGASCATVGTYTSQEEYQSTKRYILGMYSVPNLSQPNTSDDAPVIIACEDLEDNTYEPTPGDIVRIDELMYIADTHTSTGLYDSIQSPCRMLCQMTKKCDGNWRCDVTRTIFKKLSTPAN